MTVPDHLEVGRWIVLKTPAIELRKPTSFTPTNVGKVVAVIVFLRRNEWGVGQSFLIPFNDSKKRVVDIIMGVFLVMGFEPPLDRFTPIRTMIASVALVEVLNNVTLVYLPALGVE